MNRPATGNTRICTPVPSQGSISTENGRRYHDSVEKCKVKVIRIQAKVCILMSSQTIFRHSNRSTFHSNPDKQSELCQCHCTIFYRSF